MYFPSFLTNFYVYLSSSKINMPKQRAKESLEMALSQ